jgi:hypothetical protein
MPSEPTPDGIEDVEFTLREAERARLEFASQPEERLPSVEIIGKCLNALYQAATCHRGCRGGDHLLERLCGRAYNNSVAAYLLTTQGLHDEAFSLIRGLGELTNLVALLALDTDARAAWIKSDRKQRISEFGPKAVRKRLRSRWPHQRICMNDDWYAELSEGYAHPTPDTWPNRHGGLAFVGPRREQEGRNEVLKALVLVLTQLSVFVCGLFGLTDLAHGIADRLTQYVTTGT